VLHNIKFTHFYCFSDHHLSTIRLNQFCSTRLYTRDDDDDDNSIFLLFQQAFDDPTASMHCTQKWHTLVIKAPQVAQNAPTVQSAHFVVRFRRRNIWSVASEKKNDYSCWYR